MSTDITVALSTRRPLVNLALAAVIADTDDLSSIELCDDPAEHSVELAGGTTVVVIERLGRPAGEVLDDAAALCGAIASSIPCASILLLIDPPSDPVLVELLRLGVRGVFTPNQPLGLFPAAVRSLSRSEAWLSRGQVGDLIDLLVGVQARSSATHPYSIPGPVPTRREREILSLMANGLGHRQIAERLGLSPHTARTHIRNTMRKLGAHQRVDAVRIAIDTGIIPRNDVPR